MCILTQSIRIGKSLSSLFLLFSLILSITSYSQVSEAINSHRNKEQQQRYSKSTQLVIHSSSISNRINKGDQLTIFLPTDYAVSGLSNKDSDELMVHRNANSIKIFVEKYVIEGSWDFDAINSKINSANLTYTLINKKQEKLTFSKNGDKIMVTTPSGFEANIESSIKVNNAVIFYLDGMLR